MVDALLLPARYPVTLRPIAAWMPNDRLARRPADARSPGQSCSRATVLSWMPPPEPRHAHSHVVLTLYFVSSLDAIKRAAAALVPAYRRARFSAVLEEITTSVGGAVAGGVTLSMINAAVVFVLQLLIGSSVPVLMALAAFFITLVPMFGSVIFLVVGTVGALFIGPTAALVFALAYFVYIQIEAYRITPKVMGHAVDVPGVLIIIGAMTGAALLGLMGALLAIPVTASILIIIRQITVPRRDAQIHPPPK